MLLFHRSKIYSNTNIMCIKVAKIQSNQYNTVVSLHTIYSNVAKNSSIRGLYKCYLDIQRIVSK